MRRTQLADVLVAHIHAHGPIGIDDYMNRCLTDAEHGYYTRQSGIGEEGDFTTSPEISQVFGELVGLWMAVVWQQMGAPARFNLVELGPGRGVLMADALRAGRVVNGFLAAIDLHLCEINPAFRSLQSAQLAASGIHAVWHDDWQKALPTLPPRPTIVIANEFLDTIPGIQARLQAAGDWRELRVGINDCDELVFLAAGAVSAGIVPDLPGAEPGTIYTHADYSELTRGLGQLAGQAPLAALFIDYGHDVTAWGDTLQAVRRHKPEHPLVSPGAADLSLAVDFQAFRQNAEAVSLAADGPISQAGFLGQLGIMERASKLMASNPARAGDIESGVFRLMAAPGMGNRFLAIGLRSAALQPLPGFATQKA